MLKKSGKKDKKRRYKDSDSDSKWGFGLGCTRKVIKLGETVTNLSYTPPSPIKATPTSISIANNSYDVSTASVSKAGDVMMTSSSQKGILLKKRGMLVVPLLNSSISILVLCCLCVSFIALNRNVNEFICDSL